MRRSSHPVVLLFAFAACTAVIDATAARAADVFVRFRVTRPAGEPFRVAVGGFPHKEPWHFPERTAEVAAGAWSDWVDLRDWPWPPRFRRAGGVAEWPAMWLRAARSGSGEAVHGVTFEVQLADQRADAGVVHSFSETSESATVAFLVPHPLREHAKEFETGSQMTARHLAWAKEATGGKPVELKQFRFLTSLWGPYDPALARRSIETLRVLGFNAVGSADPAVLRAMNMPTYTASWLYMPDPATQAAEWRRYADGALKQALQTEDGKWGTERAVHWVISDEITTLDFRQVKPEDLDRWFREYLTAKGVTDADLGRPIGQARYPAAAMHEKTLPRDADLATRRLMYHAAKFGHWWSAAQVRRASDLIRGTLPGAKTETLPADHGFFGAWGPPHLGMGYRMLDLFELGAQETVDQLSSEDWLGLNHMYGPGYTWSGAQSFAYFNALCRGAIGERPIHLRALVTPSDDRYLRLKTYSALGQGTKSFFFWTFGPTYIGTENYWSDLRSEYDGIVKLGRAIQQAEDVLYPAKPVRDPVAVLYSVSHDLWHNDHPAPFVEKRLTWHALRHLGVQPDFVREEDVAAGALSKYKVLYVTDWCVSRSASAAIDAWVVDGGVVHLSAGAATRDEFNEPYLPPFAEAVWPADAAARMRVQAGHSFNERTDLPAVPPMTHVRAGGGGVELPVLGCRVPVVGGGEQFPVRFVDDETLASSDQAHGDGRVLGWGFMPMLAYGQLAGFKPTTLEERWPDAPRDVVRAALHAGAVTPVVRPDVPVVEASLLAGENGYVVVLANYTYEPIESLTVELSVPPHRVTSAISTEGKAVRLEHTPDGVRLRLPLEWTDLVILPAP
jgi:hypothetical protein